MHRTALVMAILVVLAVVPAGGSAEDDGAPLADAGLDQRAEVGETVLLDASGSRDPDGRIETYEWQIETPNGRTVTPADPTDPRTRFVVQEPGRYEVTVTVTDDEGKRRADTLYVYVAGSGAETVAVGPPGGEEVTLAPTYMLDTLVIEGSDLTYSEDVAYRYYSINEKLPGRKIGDGQDPINEFKEGSTGMIAGGLQIIVGTKRVTFSYMVSGETARNMEGMTDYSKGDKEDEIAEKLNTRSDAPAVLEDYVLNDARIVDGINDRSNRVRVVIRVTENKGAVDFGIRALGKGIDIVTDTGHIATSKISNGVISKMNGG